MAKVIVLFADRDLGTDGNVTYESIEDMALDQGALRVNFADGSYFYISSGEWVTAELYQEEDE